MPAFEAPTKLRKRRVKCPMCFTLHYWPTEDYLCKECEVEWVDFIDSMFKEKNVSNTREIRHLSSTESTI